jgi:Tol biopolymer transport system component
MRFSGPKARSAASRRRRPCAGAALVAFLPAALVASGAVPALAVGPTERVSVGLGGADGDSVSVFPAISRNGLVIAFVSAATNLIVGDTNNVDDVFVHDRATGLVERVSVGAAGAQSGEGSGSDGDVAISGDGRFVAFTSFDDSLVPVNTNGLNNVFLRDREAGVTGLVSVPSAGGAANGASFDPSISDSGRYVAFASRATNLVPGDTNGRTDVFVRDRRPGGGTTRVSLASNGAQGNDDSSDPSLSADGRFVAFASLATNLVPGDTNGRTDVFVRDRTTGTTTRISKGVGLSQPNGFSFGPRISANGRYVAFVSRATNLVQPATSGEGDVFVHDRQTGVTSLASVPRRRGGRANGPSGLGGLAISGNGRFVAFDSEASNLVAGDTNGRTDVFVRDRQLGTTTRLSVPAGGGEADGDSGSFGVTISGGGFFVAYSSDATNLVPGDASTGLEIFRTAR